MRVVRVGAGRLAASQARRGAASGPCGGVEALGPAGELAGNEAFGVAEGLEADGGRVDAVEGGEGVDEGVAEAGGEGGVGLKVGREVEAGEGDAVAAFGDEEGGADEGGVVAEEVGAGGEGEGFVEAGEDVVLAGHVVGAGGDGAEGRAAEDVFGVWVSEEVGEVGVAAGEAPDFGGSGGAGEAGGEVGEEAGGVDGLFWGWGLEFGQGGGSGGEWRG